MAEKNVGREGIADIANIYLAERGIIYCRPESVHEDLERMRDAWNEVRVVAFERGYDIPYRVDLRRYEEALRTPVELPKKHYRE